jgi:hypothetical protein
MIASRLIWLNNLRLRLDVLKNSFVTRTTMTELSPAAQAVLDAYIDEDRAGRLAIAAVLRAAVDQVVPPAVMLEYYERNESPVLGKALEIRGKLLAIAAELEGFN